MRFNRLLWHILILLPITIHDATAKSPPSMPLPACEEVNGTKKGACPSESSLLSGSASGTFTTGGTVLVKAVPADPVCDYHNGYPPYPWSPSPCFSAVSAATVVGCAYIDLQDNQRFRETPCTQALYKSSLNLPTLFTRSGKNGASACGGAGNYQTYVYGGAANVAGARWAERGNDALECNIKFDGPRPDGLYGPTWVKIRVGITQAQNGDERRGRNSGSTDFYVAIDGDMREEFIDVSLLASSVLQGSEDNQTVTVTATLTNHGTKDAEGVEVSFKLPEQLHYKSASDVKCRQSGTGPFTGGGVICEGLTVAGSDDPLGRDVIFIDLETRVTNIADLEDSIEIIASVPDDLDTSDNEDSTKVTPSINSGTIADTRQAMIALEPYFNYKTPDDLLGLQCDVYMDDIFSRLEAIRKENPALFTNISYGKVTSGDYYWAPVENKFTRAGHVGVVVYAKGTNYHDTGIIIHGTPTWSPADLDLNTQVGKVYGVGDHVNSADFAANFIQQGTQSHGMYYRTPVKNFPGSPTPELPLGCGYEGLYATNQDEFRSPLPRSCVGNSTQTCPMPPNAVVVRTESPVDILLTTPKAKRVQTREGKIFLHELNSGIHSYSMPHDDGTFSWLLVLPKDDYDVQVTGTESGSYKLTLASFNDEGEPEMEVYEGATQQGQVDEFEILAADPETSSKGGGGSFHWLLLLPTLPIILWRLRRKSVR